MNSTKVTFALADPKKGAPLMLTSWEVSGKAYKTNNKTVVVVIDFVSIMAI